MVTKARRRISRKEFRNSRDANYRALSDSRFYRASNLAQEARVAEEIGIEMLSRGEDGARDFLDKSVNLYKKASELYSQNNPRQAARYLTKASHIYDKFFGIDTNEMREDARAYRREAAKMREDAQAYRHEAAKRRVHGWRGLVHRAFAGVLLLSGVFFINGSITGSVIGSLNNTNSSSIGVVLFLCGLTYLFFVFRNA